MSREHPRELVAARPFSACSLASKKAVLGSRHVGQSEVVDQRLVDLLATTRSGFLKKEALVRRLTRQAGSDRAPFERLVTDLLRDGLLISGEAWLREQSLPGPVSNRHVHRAIGIPTIGRTENVRRLLKSLRLHSGSASIGLTIIVNQSESSARQLAGSVSQWQEETGIPTRQLSPTNLSRIVPLLSQASKVDRRILEFMLIPAPDVVATGAARNLLQLVTPRGHLLSVDDDVVFDGGAEEDRESVHFRNAGGFLTPESVSPMPRDPAPIAVGWMNELFEMLGRPASQFVTECSQRGWFVDLQQLGTDLMREIESSARLAVVRPCVVGDSGLDTPLSYAWRMVTSGGTATHKARWDDAVKSTRVSRREPGHTLYAGSEFVSMAYGCEITNDIVPFFPIGRGQDGLWAGVNRLTSVGWLQASIPVWVCHDSARTEYSGDIYDSIRRVTCTEAIGLLIEETARGLSQTPGEAVINLGRRLCEMSARSRADYKEMVTASASRVRRSWMDRLERDLHDTGRMRHMLGEYQQCERAAGDFLKWAIDGSTGCQTTLCIPEWHSISGMLRMFGEALMCWKDVVAAASQCAECVPADAT